MKANLKSAIEALKAIVFEAQPAQPAEQPVVEQKFVTAKLVDGTEIKFIEEMVVGAAVIYVADEQPLADGEYQLEDGTKFKVAGGLVTEIEAKEETPAEEAPAEQPAEMVQMEEQVNPLQSQVDELTANIQTLTATVEELGKQLADKEAKIVELSAQPAATPVILGVEKNENHILTPEERYENYRKATKKK